MKYKIKPYKGAGQIKLGMTSDEIKEIMKSNPKKFIKANRTEYKADMHDGFFVYYKFPGVCDAIEFYNSASVIFKGKYLFNMSYLRLKDFFKTLDKEVEFTSIGLTSLKYGIGVYAPLADEEPQKYPEGIIVFEKGYYDK